MKKNSEKKINVLMCCSKLTVKGGMVSVVKNYLSYDNWDKYNIIYVPTHIEKNKVLVAIYFFISYIKIFFLLLFKNIKIAHLHTAERGSFYRKAFLVRLCKVFGVKTIMHHHAAEFDNFYASLSKKRKKYVNNILELTDINIVLSQRLVSMVKDKAHKANVSVLYNAVKVYEYNMYNNDASNILFLGRIGERKGIYDLLKAIKLINNDLPEDIKLFICGDGEINEIKSEIEKSGLVKRVAYVGWINDGQKHEFFRQACLNVLPSYNEGLPMSILETMAYGIPNISTNIASIPEVIFDGVNGSLIVPGDVEELAKKIREFVLNKELRVKYSDESFRLISSEFSLENHISKLKSIYSILLGNRQ